MRAEMRQFLRATFGKVAGARASVPLKELQDGRWALRFLSNDVPTLYDRAGCPCTTARLCRGSLVRVSGIYEALVTPGLIPIMQAVQVCQAIQDNAVSPFPAFEAA